MKLRQWISSVGAACVIAGFFICLVIGLAGCGGGGGGGSDAGSGAGSPVHTLGYTLTGKVVLPDGSSGPNILVLADRVEENGVSRKQARVLAAGPDNRRDFLNTLQTIKGESSGTYATVTDAEGVYVLNGLQEGTYYIEASRAGMKATSRATVSPLEAAIVDLALTPTGGITGYCVLQDAADGGNAGTFVVIKGTDYIGFTDDDGFFTIDQIPVGGYQVSFIHPGYESHDYPAAVVVPAADLASLDSVSLIPVTGGTVTGTVTAQDQQPLENVMVSVSESDGAEYFAMTDDLGKYRIGGVEPGTYTVGFKHDLIKEGYQEEDVPVEEGVSVTVDAGLTDGKAPVWESAPGVVYVFDLDGQNYGDGGAAASGATSEISVAVEFGSALDASPPLTVMVYHNRVENWDPDQWENNNPAQYGASEIYDGVRGEAGCIVDGLESGTRYIFGVRMKDRHDNLEYNRSEYLFVQGDDGSTAEERENLLTAVGNIGIGTKDPQGILHIESESGSAFVVNGETGNVGIGTTDPHAAFTVGSSDQQQTGTSSTTGTFAVDSTGNVISGSWQGDAIADDYIESVSSSKITGDIAASQISGAWQGDPIADDYIESVSGSKITGTITGASVEGDIAGSAANVTGVVSVENGGTGATTAEDARTNLGIDSLTTTVSGGPEGSIEDETITTDDIASGAITSDDIAADAITAAKIAADTITNTEINTAAAIAGTKIKPDFGTQNIITMGKMGIATAEPKADLHVVGSVIVGPAFGITGEAGMVQFDGTGFKGYDGTEWKALDSLGSTGTAWGGITGTLEDQTDLQGELDSLQTSVDAKEAAITAGAITEYYRGDKTWQTLTSTAVTEGDNLYWTQTRFDTSFSAKTVPDLSDVELTTMEDGQLLKYSASKSRWENWTPDFAADAAWGGITGTLSDQTDLQGELDSLQTAIDGKEAAITAGTTTEYYRGDKTWQPITTTAVTEGDNLYWTQTRFDTALTGKTTDFLTEGSVNKYHTQQNFDTALSGKTTDNLTEGSTNKYWSQSQFDTSFSAKTVPDLSDVETTTMEDGQLLKYNTSTSKWENWTPDFASSTAWGDVTGTLTDQTDLQGELDSLQTAIDAKEAAITAGATTEYFRGDKTWQPITTTAVTEGDNLYWTQARFDTALTGKTTDVIQEGTANRYSPWAIGDGILTTESAVGIGTGVPADKLHVNGGLVLGTTTGTNAGTIRFHGGTFEGYAGSEWKALDVQPTGSAGGWTEGTGIVTLTTAGDNVGIGTTDPGSYKLKVDGSSFWGATVELASGVTLDGRDLSTDGAKLDGITAGADVTNSTTVAAAGAVMTSDIGADVQAFHTALDSISGLTTAGDKMLYTTAADTYATAPLTGAGRALLDDADAAAQRATLGLGSAATAEVNEFMAATADNWVDAAGDTMTGTLTLPDNGLVAGTDQLVLASGNVGIGTTDPAGLLDVWGADPEIRISTSTAAVNDYAALSLLAHGTSDLVWAQLRGTYTASGDSAITFYTTTDSAVTLAEQMRITHDGNVGIGTATPGALLDVQGGAQFGTGDVDLVDATGKIPAISSTYFASLDGSALTNITASAGATLEINNTSIVATDTGSDGTIVFTTDNTEVMRITNAGKVGIGTTAPINTLHAVGTGSFGDSVTAGNATRALNLISTDAVMRVMRVSADIDTAAPSVELMHRTSADGSDTDYWDFFVDSNGFNIRDRSPTHDTRVTIDNSGNVGIGTTTPTALLHLNKTGNVGLQIDDNGARRVDVGHSETNGGGYYNLFDEAGNKTVVVRSYALSGTQAYFTAGNVGIGTETPGNLLDVQGGAQFGSGDVDLVDATGKIPAISSTYFASLDGSALTNLSGGSNITTLNTSVATTDTGDNGTIAFTTDGLEAMRIDKDGKVGIGTTSPSAPLEVKGQAAADGDSIVISGNIDLGGYDLTEYADQRGALKAKLAKSNGDHTGYVTFGTPGGYGPGVLLDDTTATNRSYIQHNNANNYFELNADGGAGSIYMNGNVGIGTTAPGALLDVQGGAQFGSGNVDLVDATGKIPAISSTYFASLDGSALTNLSGGSNISTFDTSVATTDTGTDGTIAFKTNNAEIMRITADGKVGIGTTAPGKVLHVVGDAQRFDRIEASSFGPSHYFNKARGSLGSEAIVQDGDVLGGHLFQGYDSTTYESGASIRAVVDGTPGTDDMPTRLEFATTPDGAHTAETRMVIKNDGKVGIGTTDPGFPFHVQGGSEGHTGRFESDSADYSSLSVKNTTVSTTSFFMTAGGSTGSSVFGLGTQAGIASLEVNSANQGVIGNRQNAPLKFGTNDLIRMTISSAGNVGIGTTSPGYDLHVDGTLVAGSTNRVGMGDQAAMGELPNSARIAGEAANVSLSILPTSYGSSGAKTGLYYYNQSTWYSGLELANVASGYSKLLLMKSGGNVGIGTDAPGSKLDVNGEMRLLGSTAGYVGFTAPASVTTDYTLTLPAADGTADQVLSTDGSGVLSWATAGGGSSLWTDNSGDIYYNDGNVGIGTTAPGGKLDVRDGSFALSDADISHAMTSFAPAEVYGKLQVNSSTDGGLRMMGFSDADTTALKLKGIIGILDPTDTTPAIVIQGEKYNNVTSGAPLAGTETVLQIQNSTSPVMTVLGSGNVGIGTTAPGEVLDVAGTANMTALSIGGTAVTATAAELNYVDGVTSAIQAQLDGMVSSASPTFTGDVTMPGTGTWKNTGKVGIGNSDPTAKLEIVGADASNIIEALRLDNAATDGRGSKIVFYQSGTPTETGRIANFFDDVKWSMRLGSYDTQELLTLAYPGNVGIGATHPESKLQIGTPNASETIGSVPVLRVLGDAQSQSSQTMLRLNRPLDTNVYYSGGVDFNVYAYGASTGGYLPQTQLDIALKSAGNLTETGNTTVMSLRDNGNIGIGTTAPGAKLDVSGEMRLLGSTAGYIGFTAPASVTTNYTLTLPAADGTTGQVLSTNGSGVLSWATAGGASALTDLSDAIYDGSSLFLGTGSGASDDGSNANTAVGKDAMKNITTGVQNTAVGYSALNAATAGRDNSALGTYSLYSNTSDYNIGLGGYALQYNTTGTGNVGVGFEAGRHKQAGNYNTLIGHNAGRVGANHDKSNCVIIGANAGGGTSATGSGNIFLGYQAGYNESGSNKLYIENSNSATPLIYGEFDNDIVAVNGDLQLKDGTTAGNIALFEGSGDGTNKVTIQSQAMAADYILTLPADDGDADQVLSTNGSGVLSWATAGGGIGATIEVDDTSVVATDTGTDGTIKFITENNPVMEITTAGTVKVGTESMVSTIDVFGNVLQTLHTADTASPNLIHMKGRGTPGTPAAVQDGDMLGVYMASGHDGTAYIDGAGIIAEVDGTPGTNDMPGRLIFATTPDGQFGPVDRMVIKNDGKVGIGTTDPAANLHIGGGDLLLDNNQAINFKNAAGAAKSILSLSSGDITQIGTPMHATRITIGTDFNFRDQSADSLMTIKHEGKVGIGSTDPAAKLDVAGIIAATTNPSAPDSSAAAYFWNQSDIGPTISGLKFQVQTGNTGSQAAALTIDDTGKVGIGTTEPGELLYINQDNAGGNTVLHLENADNTNVASHGKAVIRVGGASGGDPFVAFDVANVGGWTVGLDNSDGDKFKFDYGSSPYPSIDTKMTIDSAGNVGIGTTAPGAKLELKGSSDATQFIVKANATQSNTNPLIKLQKSDGTELMRIHSDDITNTFIGLNAGNANDVTGTGTEGLYNVFVGSNAGAANTTGYWNVALGTDALSASTTATKSVAIGYGALEEHSGSSGSNTAVGSFALNGNTSGYFNTALGSSAFNNNTSGDKSIGVGSYSGRYNTVGDANICIGYYANEYNQEGSQNVIIGSEAGRGSSYHNKSGNIFIGYQAGYNETGSNKLYIDNSNTATPLIHGDFSTDAITINGALTVTGTASKPGGGSWADSSDERLKTDITGIDGQQALEKLTSLRGVTFQWKNPGEHGDGVRAGVIAQDLEQVFPEWVTMMEPRGEDRDLVPEGETVRAISFPHDFNAYLIEAIKEQQAQLEEKQSKIEVLEDQNAEILSRLEALEAK